MFRQCNFISVTVLVNIEFTDRFASSAVETSEVYIGLS